MKVKKPSWSTPAWVPDLLRRKKGSGDAEAEDSAVDGTQMVKASLLSRATTGLMVGGMAAAFVAVPISGVALQNSSSQQSVKVPRVVDRSNERAIAGEFAQRIIVAWLTSTRDKPAPVQRLVPGVVDLELPVKPYEVGDVTVSSIKSEDGQLWAVTVAGTVTDAKKRKARRFYTVPVAVTGGAATALSLPTPVPAPKAAQPPRSAYDEDIPARSQVAQAVGAFLMAYTAGQGEVSRYVTPGSGIRAISPAPYASIEVEGMKATVPANQRVPRDGARTRVLTYATGVVSKSQRTTVSFALTLQARDGRWEVSLVDQMPAVRRLKNSPGQPTRSVPATGTSPSSGSSTSKNKE